MMRTAMLGLVAMTVLALGAATASAQAPAGDDAAAAKGEDFYAVTCADCHGLDGRGTGPMARFLTVKPTDLTTLSRRNDGVFPFRRVFDVVDGRTVVPPHGTRPSMPLWGSVFQEVARERFGPYGTESYVRGRLMELVLYLETIQQ